MVFRVKVQIVVEKKILSHVSKSQKIVWSLSSKKPSRFMVRKPQGSGLKSSFYAGRMIICQNG